MEKAKLLRLTDYLWEIPQDCRSDMRVPARVYALDALIAPMLADRSLEQLVNVATLPGIVGAALAMPDAHEGYGFPIGGVAATKYPDGAISPGGIGYDINCGVRLLVSEMFFDQVKNLLEALSKELYAQIPSGVGKGGEVKLSPKEMDAVLTKGAEWAVKKGYGRQEDLMHIESHGRLAEADPACVSDMAKKRGLSAWGLTNCPPVCAVWASRC